MRAAGAFTPVVRVVRLPISLTLCCLTLVVASPVTAQRAPSQTAAVVWDSSHALVTRREVLTTGAFILATAIASPFDGSLAREAQETEWQHPPAMRRTAAFFRELGDPGTVVLSLGAYGTGVLLQNRTVADVGLHATGAIVTSAVLTSVLKGAFGRARPYAVGDSMPGSFGVGRGFGGGGQYQSFPSGHTTAAFAVAAVLASESHHRWPRHARYIAPIAYAAAALVGASRVYNDKHWLSDVMLGAGVGTLSGMAVVRRQHATSNNWIDRVFLPSGNAPTMSATVSAAPAGRAGLTFSVRF